MAEKIEAHKAEGSMVVVPVLELNNNPRRSDDVFKWNENKISALVQSYIVDGFQSTFEVTLDKWLKAFLSGGGHHRTESLRRIIRGEIEGVTPEMIRGLFKQEFKEDGKVVEKWCIKVVKKKYTDEQMMRNFLLENAEAWGKDDNQNKAMMIVQVEAYLTGLMNDSKDVDDFIEKVKSPYPLKTDDRAFTRAKNAGRVSAQVISEYLGVDAFPRTTVQQWLSVMTEGGEAMRELAEKLPNVSMAYRVQNFMTDQEEDGTKVRASDDDVKKAAKIIEKESLSRTDIDKANKIKAEKGVSPLDALAEVVDNKKDELKAKKEASKKSSSTPERKEMEPPEATLDALKRTCSTLNVMVNKDHNWSKAQLKEALSLFNTAAERIKVIQERTAKGKKKSNNKK